MKYNIIDTVTNTVVREVATPPESLLENEFLLQVDGFIDEESMSEIRSFVSAEILVDIDAAKNDAAIVKILEENNIEIK